MAVVAGGLDEDAAHMGVAGLGDGTEGVAPGVMVATGPIAVAGSAHQGACAGRVCRNAAPGQ